MATVACLYYTIKYVSSTHFPIHTHILRDQPLQKSWTARLNLLGKVWLSERPGKSKVQTSVAKCFFFANPHTQLRFLQNHAINFLICSQLYSCVDNKKIALIFTVFIYIQLLSLISLGTWYILYGIRSWYHAVVFSLQVNIQHPQRY